MWKDIQQGINLFQSGLLRHNLYTVKCTFLGHRSITFDKYMQLCNYHHNQNMEHSISLRPFVAQTLAISFPFLQLCLSKLAIYMESHKTCSAE